jgi:N-acetylmuramoyl-L-alanine amidase
VRLWNWILLISILLIIPAQQTFASSNHPIEVIFDGHPLDSQVKVIDVNGNYYINLPFLSRYLNMIIAWNVEANDLFLKFGKTNIKFYANSSTYYMDGKKQQLASAPFEQDKQFWLPVQFLTKLGLTIKSQNQQQFILEWSQNYLLGVEITTYQNRPAFLLEGTKDLKIDTSVSQSNQLVLNLPGAAVHFSMNENIDIAPFTMVTGVHFIKNDPAGLKIAFDLNQTIGYQLIPQPDRPHSILLVFNYVLQQINALSPNEEYKIAIATSAPAEYQVQNSNHHLAIDFVGATLAGDIGLTPNDEIRSPQIHLAQINRQIVRMVLDMPDSSTYYVFQLADNPNLLEVRKAQTIQEIKWVSARDGSELHIMASDELISTITQDQATRKLEIQFDNVRMISAKLPAVNDNFVDGIQLKSINPTIFKFEINLKRFVTYKAEYSENRDQLVVRFKRSPIIRKTIVIDPGHGGIDNGAVGRQIREKDLNLEIAMRLKNLLEEAGAAVILTRDDDYFIGLYERPYLANYYFADLFISVHTNNHPDLSVHGIEVFHYPQHQSSHLLAQSVFREITQQTGFLGLGVKQENFVVVREAQMPSILVEVGFLSNFQEESIMKTAGFKDNAAMGIYQGVINYFNTTK